MREAQVAIAEGNRSPRDPRTYTLKVPANSPLILSLSKEMSGFVG